MISLIKNSIDSNNSNNSRIIAFFIFVFLFALMYIGEFIYAIVCVVEDQPCNQGLLPDYWVEVVAWLIIGLGGIVGTESISTRFQRKSKEDAKTKEEQPEI